MLVREVMTTSPVTVRPGTTMPGANSVRILVG